MFDQPEPINENLTYHQIARRIKDKNKVVSVWDTKNDVWVEVDGDVLAKLQWEATHTLQFRAGEVQYRVQTVPANGRETVRATALRKGDVIDGDGGFTVSEVYHRMDNRGYGSVHVGEVLAIDVLGAPHRIDPESMLTVFRK